jgi:hypothetical protein
MPAEKRGHAADRVSLGLGIDADGHAVGSVAENSVIVCTGSTPSKSWKAPGGVEHGLLALTTCQPRNLPAIQNCINPDGLYAREQFGWRAAYDLG